MLFLAADPPLTFHPDLQVQSRWARERTTKTHAWTRTLKHMHAHTHSSRLKEKKHCACWSLVLLCFLSSSPFPSHCFLPQSHAEVEGGKTGRKKHTLSPPSSSPPPASLTFYLSLSSFLLLPFSPSSISSSTPSGGWQDGVKVEGGIWKAKEEESERSSFNLPHSCDHLQPEALFTSASGQNGRKRETEGEEGELGRKSSPPCCCPCASKETIYLYPSACMQKRKQSGFFKIPHLRPNLSLRPLIIPPSSEEQQRDGATETLLCDVLWLIETTFNLCQLPPALV